MGPDPAQAAVDAVPAVVGRAAGGAEAVVTPEVARVTANLPVKVWAAVERMATEQAISRTEALRRCISTEAWRRGVEAEGGELCVRRPDGSIESVHFPW